MNSTSVELESNKPRNKKPVLLQVLPSLISGGVERGTVEIARAVVEAGFVSLVASSGGPMADNFEKIGTTHIKLNLKSKNPLIIWLNILRLKRIIRKHNVDIIHARSRAPAWSSYFAAKITKTHFITTFHGVYSVDSAIKKFYNSIMTKGEKIIAVSQYVKNHIINTYGINTDKIEVIYRGVDTEYFDPQKISPERLDKLKSEWGIRDKKPVIFMPGRITRWKGQNFLIDSLKKLPTRNYYCIIAGDNKGHDDYMEELQNKIKKYSLPENIRIVKATNDMPAAYMIADAVISASLRPESFGRIVPEAQAMGRPVIATKIGGSLETIIDGETGFLVKPGDTDRMAELIYKVISFDPIVRSRLTEKMIKHIKDNFSLTKTAAVEIELYKKVLAGKG